MKTFVLLAVFLFAYSFADSNESKSLEREDFKEIAEFVEEKLNSTIVYDLLKLADRAKENCPGIEDKLENAVEKISECVTDIELGSNTLCGIIRENWSKCSKPGIDAIASCLPDESKGIPVMFGKMMRAILDLHCNSTVEEILELFNPCIFNREGGRSEECTEVKKILASSKGKLPSTNFVCSIIPKGVRCAEKHEETCKNPITKRANLHLHQAIEDGAKDECDVLNEA